MDFSVIRRKSRPKKPDAPPPKSPSPPPQPSDKPPQPQPPPGAKPPPPPPPANSPPPFEPYMEDLDHASRVHRLRSIEYSNARTWRVNFDDYPNQYFGHYEYNHYPTGIHAAPHNFDHHHMFTPPPDYHRAPPPYLGLPPLDYHRALPGAPHRLGLPQPDYHPGAWGPPPNSYYYPPPHYGGFFSDENPNGCVIM